MISIILTVYNKQDLIEWVLNSINENISSVTKELIIVIDGCTDRSEQIIKRTVSTGKFPPIKFIYENDVFEVRANNAGLRKASYPYCMIIQDDMVIQEKDFDKKLLTPFNKFSDTFAVSARTAHDNTIINNELHHVNISGRESGLAKGIYSVRDSCNRGPLLLQHEALEKLNYLDDAFAPINLDDHDLCMRAWTQLGLVSGAYMIDYRSDHEWGSSHTPKAATIVHKSWMKNVEIIKSRHYSLLMGEKHDEERECLYLPPA